MFDDFTITKETFKNIKPKLKQYVKTNYHIVAIVSCIIVGFITLLILTNNAIEISNSKIIIENIK